MLAKVNAVLSAPSRNRPLRREFEQDWQLLQSLAANVVAYEFPDEDRKALPRFRQVREVVSVGKRGQQLLVTITH
jgi:hypothetical protein